MIVDDGFDHAHRGGVERGVGPSGLADRRGDFGNRTDGVVLPGDQVGDLFDAGVGHGGRHEEETSLVERRDEFAAESGEGVLHGAHHFGMTPRFRQHPGERGRAAPAQKAPQHHEERQRREEQLMAQHDVHCRPPDRVDQLEHAEEERHEQ